MTGKMNKIDSNNQLISKNICAADKPGKGNSKHDLLLSVLKHDYGYVNDKAVAELERLFRQFHSINKNTRSHPTRLKPNFRHDI